MIRWKGLLFLLVLAGLVVGASYIFTDQWLENLIESNASNINGAKIEIDNLDFSFAGPDVTWDRLQVTNPQQTMQNVIETGRCEFKLEFWPLLSKKFIIENFQIAGLQTNTQRETDGALPKVPEAQKDPNIIEKTAKNLENEIAANPNLMLSTYSRKVNVDSLIRILDIQSVDNIDSLQNSIQSEYTQWEQRLSQKNIQKKLDELEGKIRSLQLEDLQTVQGFKSTLNEVEEIQTSIDSMSKVVQNTKNDLLTDLKDTRSGLGQIDNWVKQDYQRAMSKAQLPDINAQNIGRFVFGQKVISETQKYLGYISTAREYADVLRKDDAKNPRPPRFEGQDIHYYKRTAEPRLWIKNVELSGQTANRIQIRGNVKDIVSDQQLINAMTVIDITGDGESGADLSIDGTLNYLEEIPQEKFQIQYAGFSLAKSNISNSPFLPYEIDQGNGVVETSLDFTGQQVNAAIKFVGERLEFNYGSQASPANRFEQIVQTVVKGIQQIDFVARIKGEPNALQFTLNSNLDNIFADQLQSILSQEVQQARQRIQQEIDTQVKKYEAELNNMIQSREQELRAEVEKYEKELEAAINLAEKKKKEIEERIEEEIDQQKNKLEDKLKDNLDNLFK
ncbi:MAG: TIGR03545 family protein [Candidatus Marinimicrobia bacterium]|nr:TIGR03545 family protein [Candidatus Neomarinimicrobiota bacterium]